MLWEGRERHKGVATWMQVRRELDSSKKGTWGKAAGSGRARDVPRKQKR